MSPTEFLCPDFFDDLVAPNINRKDVISILDFTDIKAAIAI